MVITDIYGALLLVFMSPATAASHAGHKLLINFHLNRASMLVEKLINTDPGKHQTPRH